MGAVIPWPLVPNLVVLEGGAAAAPTLAGEAVAIAGAGALSLATPEILAAIGLGIGATLTLQQLAKVLSDAGYPDIPSAPLPEPRKNFPTVPGNTYDVLVKRASKSGDNPWITLDSWDTVYDALAPFSIYANGTDWFVQDDRPRSTLVMYATGGVTQTRAWIDRVRYPSGADLTPTTSQQYPSTGPTPTSLPIGSPVGLINLPGVSVTPTMLQPAPQISPAEPLPYEASPPEYIPIALPEIGQEIQFHPDGIQFVPYQVPGALGPGKSALPDAEKAKKSSQPECDCVPNINIQPCDLTPVLNKLNQLESEINPTYDHHSATISGSTGGVYAFEQIPEYVKIHVTEYPENARRQPSTSGLDYFWLGYISFVAESGTLGPRYLINGLDTTYLVPAGTTFIVISLYPAVTIDITKFWKTVRS
jgi:hypothetical protein